MEILTSLNDDTLSPISIASVASSPNGNRLALVTSCTEQTLRIVIVSGILTTTSGNYDRTTFTLPCRHQQLQKQEDEDDDDDTTTKKVHERLLRVMFLDDQHVCVVLEYFVCVWDLTRGVVAWQKSELDVIEDEEDDNKKKKKKKKKRKSSTSGGDSLKKWKIIDACIGKSFSDNDREDDEEEEEDDNEEDKTNNNDLYLLKQDLSMDDDKNKLRIVVCNTDDGQSKRKLKAGKMKTNNAGGIHNIHQLTVSNQNRMVVVRHNDHVRVLNVITGEVIHKVNDLQSISDENDNDDDDDNNNNTNSIVQHQNSRIVTMLTSNVYVTISNGQIIFVNINTGERISCLPENQPHPTLPPTTSSNNKATTTTTLQVFQQQGGGEKLWLLVNGTSLHLLSVIQNQQDDDDNKIQIRRHGSLNSPTGMATLQIKHPIQTSVVTSLLQQQQSAANSIVWNLLVQSKNNDHQRKGGTSCHLIHTKHKIDNDDNDNNNMPTIVPVTLESSSNKKRRKRDDDDDVDDDVDANQSRKNPASATVLGPGQAGSNAMHVTDGPSDTTTTSSSRQKRRKKEDNDDDDEDNNNDMDVQDEDEEEEEEEEEGPTVAERLAQLRQALNDDDDDEDSEDDDDNDDDDDEDKMSDDDDENDNNNNNVATNDFQPKNVTTQSLTRLVRQALLSGDDAMLELALDVRDKDIIYQTCKQLVQMYIEERKQNLNDNGDEDDDSDYDDDDGSNNNNTTRNYMDYCGRLLIALTNRLALKPQRADTLCIWIRIVLQSKYDYGMLWEKSYLQPIRNLIQERIEIFPTILKLQGRLDMKSF